jgi:HPt (histidine-containing phosphotransfer) domain-containing protein
VISGTPDVWLDAIRAREQLLGEDAVRRMAEMFVEEVDPLLSKAQDALLDGDLEEARKAVHNLGGNAGCLDFDDLTVAIQDAERACVNGQPHDAFAQLSLISPLARNKADLLRRHYRIT